MPTRTTRKWPEHIDEGFDFDEAIAMAEMCRRVYRIFDEGQTEDESRELYEALYYRDTWEFVHAICDYATDGRCMIVRHRRHGHYAIVFRGTVFTGEGIDYTTAATDLDLKLVECDEINGDPEPPPRNARLHQGFAKAYATFRDEIHFFFDILSGAKLDQKLLVDLIETDAEERRSRILAIGAAIGALYGRGVGIRAARNITRLVREIRDGHIDAASVSFNTLVERGIYFHRVLAELIGEGREDRSVDEPLEVYVAGHSLGGALATLCILDLKRSWSARRDFVPFRLKGYTIGQPKAGNEEMARYFNGLLAGYNFRVRNLLDPVVHAPTLLSILTAPMPYNLQLLTPGIKYIKVGDEFYDWFAHVGEAYTLVGLGKQKFEVDFGGPLKFSVPLPFPHGPDGYIELLESARTREGHLLNPARRITKTLFGDQRKQLANLERQVAEARRAIDKIAANQAS